jgi:hypothetical protein
VDFVLPLDEIPPALVALVTSRETERTEAGRQPIPSPRDDDPAGVEP